MSSLLKVNNLEFGYLKLEPLLNGVSFALSRGELIWVTGPAGCGKSTLLRLILGELQPSSGQVEINGRPLNGRSSWSKSELRKRIGLLRLDETLLPERSLSANVELPLKIRGYRQRRRRQRVAQVLRALALAGKANLQVGRLSDGEQRLTALARALVSSPPLILAELDSGNLDRGLVLDNLRQAASFGSAVLILAESGSGREPEYRLAGEALGVLH
jgi:cell division transport system ATP-binding protein